MAIKIIEGEGFELKSNPEHVDVTLKMLDDGTAMILLKWTT
ncbi:unnamed protein product [marine sediment metagenome]|uniref:Uncharacterized protein n=1 Tax=marine sediment metagenome TaxID=412755 RepID=X0YM11_9ZZZZ